ncbi:short chain dehydrogenase [Cucurbitaria berberidis CBS 394.84]|uniref:Short chain dehydrogenase n=1 Tax=Cucurbitaria berberidis CBS 394.84 TaxID=1168544 RepID=A0A9P4LEG9_9PLEO|nr:short chain dehydrogenase [Cucurbitaria berberidis CBS 394.84]KAF1851903.1 short chain dehydrogenase [Cucurbitaria berberidis CBS 394.84]
MSRYAETHKNPQGPGDARPTALQIVRDNDLIGKLEGKVALVTGTSSGIGMETARALKATGMRVFGAVRNIAKATEALKDDLEPGHLELVQLDMNSLDSVRACAKELLSKTDKLHIFVANAGIMMTPEGKTADGFELQFGTNHLAHFLLFQLLKPTLLASASQDFASRVIALSSVGHRGGEIQFDNINFQNAYDPMAAYAQSKLAAVYMANEIERRYGSQNLHAWSVMPGGIWTGLQANLPQGVKDMWKGDAEFQKAWKSTEQGAATTVWAALEKELEGKGGKYLEDVSIAGPAPPPTGSPADMGYPGYAAYAYDGEKEGRLWKVSCEMVGVEDRT